MDNNNRSMEYAKEMSMLIQKETISFRGQSDKTDFYELQKIMRELFPNIFNVCEFEDFNGSFLLRWKGETDKEPILFMNHQDVVEAPGDWKYPPFAGEIADGKLWGRGVLDTKGGLYCMLKAADELCRDGFVPKRDVYFESACTEECDGTGCDLISRTLKDRGIHFEMCLDEGGMIVHDPIGGADGTFAMIGVGEKGAADLKFIAKSNGGHASTPEKNSPLVRLGKFMTAVEKSNIFPSKMSDVITEMFTRLSPAMSGAMKKVLSNTERLKPLLQLVLPSFSSSANALLRTTVAFTMADGSKAPNVLPQEAYVIGNMRYSHHQGKDASIEAITKLAEKFNIETEIIDGGFESPISDFNSVAFKNIENAVKENFPDVGTVPYIMTGASDCRFMSRVCENCFRFVPFIIDDKQLASVHALNENVDVKCLAPAVDFYKTVMKSY